MTKLLLHLIRLFQLFFEMSCSYMEQLIQIGNKEKIQKHLLFTKLLYSQTYTEFKSHQQNPKYIIPAQLLYETQDQDNIHTNPEVKTNTQQKIKKNKYETTKLNNKIVKELESSVNLCIEHYKQEFTSKIVKDIYKMYYDKYPEILNKLLGNMKILIITKDTQNPNKPIQNPNKPIQNPNKPIQNPNKPIQNPNKPIQNPHETHQTLTEEQIISILTTHFLKQNVIPEQS